MEINGVAHIILRVSRFDQCVAFYDAMMPRLGLEVVYRSDDYVYYVGGRTAVGIRRPVPELAGHAHEEPAPGIDHLCFRARSREDIDELYLSLAELGAELVRAQEEGLDSLGRFRCQLERQLPGSCRTAARPSAPSPWAAPVPALLRGPKVTVIRPSLYGGTRL